MIDQEPPKLLPPAQAESTTSNSSAFDMAAFARDLKETPKQDYSSAWSEAQPKKETPPPSPPAGTAPVGDAGHGTGEESTKGEGSAKETARVVFMMYDNLVSQVCCAIADHPDYPAKRFAMDDTSRREAEKQLAIGIEKNNWLNLPWWAILLAMIVASGVANWLLVREADKQKKKEREAAAEKNRERSARGEALRPDSITDKNGQRVPTAPPTAATRPDAMRDSASPAQEFRPVKDFGACQECGNPVKHRGRKYCSQSCAGKATAKRPTQHAPATT